MEESEEKKSILHELYVYSEWKPEPEYLQKPENILPENISALWCWFNFFGPKKGMLDSVTAHKERQHKWHMALGDKGKVIAVLTDNILEIRTKRSDYATIAARTTVNRDAYPQWRKLVWSPDCTFLALAYGNGMVSFYDLTASNLFNIPPDCARPGGRECTDNTHAIADIIFMPLRVKDNKWNWEVCIAAYSGKCRWVVVSLSGWAGQRAVSLAGPLAAVYCQPCVYVSASGGAAPSEDPNSALSAGLTAWRLLNDEPFIKLSVVSDELESQLAKRRFQITDYIPFLGNKNQAYIIKMVLSPDNTKLLCLHCNGDVTIWYIPSLKLVHRWPLLDQPEFDIKNPLIKEEKPSKDLSQFYGADVDWWSNEEIILSRFNGAVTICNIKDMVNILGDKPVFFQGAPRVTCAQDGTFVILECETNFLPVKKSTSDDSMEVVSLENDPEPTFVEGALEMAKSLLYFITDLERFQPRPRRLRALTRLYRLLAARSAEPIDLYQRQIESGNYTEALALAERFKLDSDLVYQQQWRKTPVSTQAIQKYLSKVSKKIWAVHQCVDRLPESVPAARQLLQFGLELTNQKILNEINKDREEQIDDPDKITLEDLNSFTSELLRCRHVMLFYKERLRLYEAILRCEKSTYVKDEYDRLRSNSIVHSAMEIAKEGRIEALTCLWPYIKTISLQMTVLSKIPETINPFDYQHLLPTTQPIQWFEKKSPIKIPPSENENDWCRKDIFRSIWSSNWSEDASPETESSTIPTPPESIPKWYEERAKEIESRSGLVSHALTLITIATVHGGVEGLDNIMFHLLTLDTLIYDINIENVTLKQVEKLTTLETCCLLMKMSTPSTFVSDLKQYVVPFLKRYEKLSKRMDACIGGLTDYLESISVEDLSSILLVLRSPKEFGLDVRTHLELAERCIFAHTGTEQLDMACDILDTILKESDGSISSSELIRRIKEVEKLVSASTKISWRGVSVPPKELKNMHHHPKQSHNLLTRLARSLATGDEKPTQQDWEKLLKDILDLQSTLFACITKEQCYEIYASSLLTSGDAASIKLSGAVLTCDNDSRRNSHLVNYKRSVDLVSNAAMEYFNSASSLIDPTLELAKCCLTLIKDDNRGIQQELDLIASLPILNAFGVSILPIQVRLCEDRMALIEECLKLDHNAYLASHKLLKLAKLLRVAGDDEHTREGQVLNLICTRAVEVANSGDSSAWGAAATMARRLSLLKYSPSAEILAVVAQNAQPHADIITRSQLLAASATYCSLDKIEDVLNARLDLEVERLQQAGSVLGHDGRHVERWPSTDDEFADAITTPDIERKDLIAPSSEKTSLVKHLLDSFHNKSTSETHQQPESECTVYCQELYHSLYPELKVSDSHYRYDKFSTRGELNHYCGALHCYYIQDTPLLEAEVLRQCASGLLYSDTGLAVSCLLRGAAGGGGAGRGRRDSASQCALLCAVLTRTAAPALRDMAYLTPPHQLARMTFEQKNASDEHLEIIRSCMDKLTTMNEVDSLRKYGFNVNGILFNADEDYRKEIIHRVAGSPNPTHLSVALSLSRKYSLDEAATWLAHAAADPGLRRLSAATAPHIAHAHTHRIKEGLWNIVAGNDHNALINYFNFIKQIDEKTPFYGLIPSDHIKLLKKAKAALPELDYKLLLENPSPEEFCSHVLQHLKPENIGLFMKFLRNLPKPFDIPVAISDLYVRWLTKLFFSLPIEIRSAKKWVQQYRQCASYFSKLGKEDLLRFITNICFTPDGITSVPPNTRKAILNLAVAYCAQEQENMLNGDKTVEWAQPEQTLTEWSQFLDDFHSDKVKEILDNLRLPCNNAIISLEASVGSSSSFPLAVARLCLEGGLRPRAIITLLEHFKVKQPPELVVQLVLQHFVGNAEEMERFIDLIAQCSQEGITIPPTVIEQAITQAGAVGVPPARQGPLLAGGRGRGRGGSAGQRGEVLAATAHIIGGVWPDLYEELVTEGKLQNEESRREILLNVMSKCDSWLQKKAFVDVLVCWPPNTESESPSVHCQFLHSLLTNKGDQKENLVLIKLLLRTPLLNEKEIKYLIAEIPEDAVSNVIWIVLLNKCKNYKEDLMTLITRNKDTISKQDIDDELCKELLDNALFLDLIPTPLYTNIINFIMNNTMEAPTSVYTVQWATKELLKSGLNAEAGHLQLLALGVPSALRGFSETILYVKNLLSKN